MKLITTLLFSIQVLALPGDWIYKKMTVQFEDDPEIVIYQKETHIKTSGSLNIHQLQIETFNDLHELQSTILVDISDDDFLDQTDIKLLLKNCTKDFGTLKEISINGNFLTACEKRQDSKTRVTFAQVPFGLALTRAKISVGNSFLFLKEEIIDYNFSNLDY